MKTFTSDPSKYKSPREQAEAIWKEQVEPSLKQGKPVGLIYAANNDQATNIRAGYKTGAVNGLISGGGQALIYAELARMISEKKLQDKVHILPVATSMHGGDNTLTGNQVGLAQIDRDLENIASHRAAGWEIRGLGAPDGKYALGSKQNSKGWHDPQKVQITQQPDGSYKQEINPKQNLKNGISQGAYVESRLRMMANTTPDKWPDNLYQASKTPPPLTSQTTAPQFKQQNLKEPQNTAPPQKASSIFKINPNVGAPLNLQEVENSLKKAQVPVLSSEQTMLDCYIKSSDDKTKNKAADLLTIYSVKNVMGNLSSDVSAQIVNNRATAVGHDNHAMKIQFKSNEEALEFSQKLFKNHGIHSHTFGPGTMKTPQNGAIYLTKNDLEKISKDSKMTYESGAGNAAYDTMVRSFENSKIKNVDNEVDVQLTSQSTHNPG